MVLQLENCVLKHTATDFKSFQKSDAWRINDQGKLIYQLGETCLVSSYSHTGRQCMC